MTIVLPFPTPAGDAFADNDGGNGVNAPPVGAPESNAPSTVNDIQRRDKTAIKQNVENIDAINQALGTMAEQDASAVNITGGSISVQVDSAVDSDQLGGVTLQALYDALLPVGHVQMQSSFTLPVAPAGVAATWQLLTDSDGRVIRMTTASPPLTTGGSDTRTTSSDGAHDHGGATGGTALSVSQMPAHTHNTTAVRSGGAGTSGGGGIAGSATTQASTSSGSGNTHDHSITSGGDHTHDVTVLPRYMELAAYVRTA